jgi:malate dehydrogenase (oxaloacetate-decarboxylating)(NADP+)
MICGVEGRYMMHLRHITDVIGLAPGVRDYAALSLVITARGTFFLADTQIAPDPSAEEIAEMAVLAAAHVRRFGLEPKIALISHSNFGSYETESARKMQAATELIASRHPGLQVDGEMNGEAALSPSFRERVLPQTRLAGAANLLIMPNLDAANIAYQMIMMLADALPVGPILVGAARPAHVLTPSVTARGVVNMTAVAVVEAQDASGDAPSSVPKRRARRRHF